MRRLHPSLAVIALIGLCALLSTATKAQGQAPIDPNQWYNVIAKHSGLCLDVLGGSLAGGARLVQHFCHFGDNQSFRFVPVGGGFYRIIAGQSAQCIDQQGANFNNGGLFVQWFCHGGQNQQFQVILGQVGFGFFNQIRVRHSGKNMDVLGGSFASGAQIVQHIPHGGDNQQFELRPAPAVPCAGRDNDGDQVNACFDCDDFDPTVQECPPPPDPPEL